MQAWRIAKRAYALDQTGAGAQISGGRWNSPGIRVIYAALTPELAAFEKLVHTGETLPNDLVLVRLDLPDESSGLYEKISPESLPAGWNELPSSAIAVAIGDSFIKSGRGLGLVVPSAPVPEAKNVVLNPNHHVFQTVAMTIVRDFTFDPRFRPGSGSPSA